MIVKELCQALEDTKVKKTEPLPWRDSQDSEGHRNLSRQIKIQSNSEANIYQVSPMCQTLYNSLHELFNSHNNSMK